MNSSYLPVEQRKKILLLSDDARAYSGVGCVSRVIIEKTCQHYKWVQVGAAVQHPEAGKILDLSDSLAKETTVPDAFYHLYPCNGYGDPHLIRHILKAETPDAIMIFTDPRFFVWLFQLRHEFSEIPLIFYTIWDDLPYPTYNRDFYRSTDLLMGISKQTVNLTRHVLGEENVEFCTWHKELYEPISTEA